MALKRMFLTVALIALGAGLLFSPGAWATLLAAQDFQDFSGAGLIPGGGGGRLDSNRWAVLGFSDGDSGFGDSHLRGDLARGQAAGPVRSGGLYAFTLPANRVGLGIQATSSDFSPGALLWRVENTGSSIWGSLLLSFDLWVRNDGARATGVNVDLSAGNGSGPWLSLPSASHRTPGTADALGWQAQPQNSPLPVSLQAGDALLLRFALADAAGTGGRDELAFSDIRVSGELAGPPPVALRMPAALLLVACTLPLIPGTRRRRRKHWGPQAVNEA